MGGERQTDRQTDRDGQTDRQTERQREKECTTAIASFPICCFFLCKNCDENPRPVACSILGRSHHIYLQSAPAGEGRKVGKKEGRRAKVLAE